MYAKLLQLCPTLCDSRESSTPDSSVPGILQLRIQEWVAISFSRGSFWPRDGTHDSWVSCTAGRPFITEPSGKALCLSNLLTYPSLPQKYKLQWDKNSGSVHCYNPNQRTVWTHARHSHLFICWLNEQTNNKQTKKSRSRDPTEHGYRNWTVTLVSKFGKTESRRETQTTRNVLSSQLTSWFSSV